MSVQAMTWVLEHSTARLGARLILLAIANHADREGRHSFASVQTLAEEAHVSRREAQYALRELESTGEIVQVLERSRRTHVYELPRMSPMKGAESAPQGAKSARAESAPVQSLRVEGATSAPEPSFNRPKSLKNIPEHPEARRLCTLLADLIVENGSKRPKVTDAWLTEARRLLVLDKRPVEEAEQVLRWSQADEFWRGNILSMPTFRAKYDRLRLASSRITSRRETREERLARMAKEMG